VWGGRGDHKHRRNNNVFIRLDKFVNQATLIKEGDVVINDKVYIQPIL
jgi:hypothetical protein